LYKGRLKTAPRLCLDFSALAPIFSDQDVIDQDVIDQDVIDQDVIDQDVIDQDVIDEGPILVR
jgi:hypothetical protein